VRFVGPVLRAVDRPWKMYSVGVLFGFGECFLCLLRFWKGPLRNAPGFDTASSIALLAISAIDQRGPDGEGIKHCKIVIFLVRCDYRLPARSNSFG
jgi:high-affinity nickel-transport protein